MVMRRKKRRGSRRGRNRRKRRRKRNREKAGGERAGRGTGGRTGSEENKVGTAAQDLPGMNCTQRTWSSVFLFPLNAQPCFHTCKFLAWLLSRKFPSQ